MLIKINRLSLLSFVVLFSTMLESCSEAKIDGIQCEITTDDVSIIDNVTVDSTTYYLVYRVSGWNEKTEIFELYDIEPTFDHCANSGIEPLYGNSLELSKTVAHVYLNVNESKIDIEYIDELPKTTSHLNIRLEIRQDRR